MIEITVQLAAALVDALAKSFTPQALEQRVMVPLGTLWKEISGSRDTRSRLAQLVEWAGRNGKIDDLVRTAYQANPTSAELRILNESLGLVPATSGLIDAVRPVMPDVDEKKWNRSLAEVTNQICAVETLTNGKDLTGTGFLVGPDLVMTHVSVVPEKATITVVFDRAAGSQHNYGAREVFRSGDGVVVLRLDRSVGRETTPDPEGATSGRARGWLTPGAPKNGIRAVIIPQYSATEPPTISIDANGLIEGGVDGPIRYRTATHPGSTGAPCFDENWQLIGMHVGSQNDGNYGIGIQAVVKQLNEAGFTWDISSGVREVPRTRGADSIKLAGALDGLVQTYAFSADADDPADDVWSDDGEQSPSDPDRWAWAEAAAVTATFDPERLVPAGHPRPEGRVAVLLESTPVRNAAGETHWLLAERVRVRALERLAERGALHAARAANERPSQEPLDAVLGELLQGTPPTRAELQDPDRLRAMLQVSAWLARTGIALPSTAMLRAALERATLIAPFRHLTRGFFAGREGALAALAAYVDGPDVDAQGGTPPPILIYGPGGMGKSALLAHFILAHSDRDTTRPEAWRPFVYLDFDRPELDARDLAGVLLAIAQQIGPQVPQVQDAVNDLLARWRRRQQDERPKATPQVQKSRQARLARDASAGSMVELVRETADILVAVHEALPSPLLLVIDTLEEVQYATPDAVVPLAKLVVMLRAAVPSLRPVLSGRVELDRKVTLTPMPLEPLPQTAAEALLANHLPAALAAKTDLVGRMVQIVGGNPLSLRLAADMLSRETDENVEEIGEEELWQRVGDSIVQGQLYERIAGHIHEGPIRKLAIPGLVLRYITWQLIRDVLAGPCGVDVKDDAAAQALFDELAKEIAVVRQEGDLTKLVLRPHLRRTVLESLRQDARSADKRRRIHEAAVDFYRDLPGPDNRAEEIYHRLWLDQEPAEIDARWLAGIDLALRSAVEELDGRARSYLAGRVGGIDDEGIAQTAELPEWEVFAEKRASDLLRLGSAQAALDVLHMRSERLPKSRLHLIESIALRSVPNPDLAAAETAAENAVTSARSSADASEIQSALQELVQVRRLRNDTAGVLRALAELGNLGEQLGDDLILLEAEVSGLEAAAPAERFSDNAVRVFSRLPDELIARAPELARRVAAQAGGDNPDILQRVIRLVGLGPLNKTSLAGLEAVLAAWAKSDPGVESFVPKSPATAADLTSATQYLLANRSLDPAIARQLSGWLQTVVTPSVVK